MTPRRRIDVALHAVVMEAYVHGVFTRKVDDLVTALGAESGISKSEVSRICAELDTDVTAFNTRDLGEQAYPYVFLDATCCKARVGGDKSGKGGVDADLGSAAFSPGCQDAGVRPREKGGPRSHPFGCSISRCLPRAHETSNGLPSPGAARASLGTTYRVT